MREMNILNAMPTMETCEVYEKFKNTPDATEEQTEEYELHGTKAADMATTLPTGVVCLHNGYGKSHVAPVNAKV